MGSHITQSKAPDLFTTPPVREHSSHSENSTKDLPSANVELPARRSRRYVLPTDLANALRHLDDQELERLLAATLAEQKRRGRACVTNRRSNKERVETVAVTLTPSKMNAVRAAFKAGIKPSQIARQFGLSQSDVKSVLAGGRSRPG
jgi:DNA-directed RNA polymerase specialized sigma24 family protein